MYRDSIVAGGKVRIKTSVEAGDTPSAGALVTGELALNSADGSLFYATAAGGVGTFPSSSGFTRIVSLTQAEYDALTPVATTLYIVTPNP